MKNNLFGKEAEEKTNTRLKAVIAFLIGNFLITAGIAVFLIVSSGGQASQASRGGILEFDRIENGQYLLYIGLNDRHTYEQIIPTEEAREIVNAIVARHAGGYTVQDARGGWVDEHNILTQENTLVYSLIYIEEEAVAAIMDEVLVALNQNSILVERRDVYAAFYYGGNSE